MSLFAACSEEIGDINPDGGDVVDSMRVTKFDQKQFLQNSLVKVDSMGGFVQRINGAPLDQADTTVLYIGVKDVAEAKSIFKGWLAPDAELIENGDIVTVDLLDEDGREQGQVNFTPKMEYAPEPLVAVVNFSEGTDMKYVSKVKFIPADSWPNNGESLYNVGDKVELQTYNEGVQKWVCIRKAQQGVNGILVYLSHKNWILGAAYIDHLASVANAKEVANITSSNWDTFQPMFEDAGLTLADEYYWIDDWKYYVFGGGIYAINLKTKNIDWFEIVWKRPYKRYLQVSYFGELN